MRRLAIGTFALGGVALALACGHQIDTEVPAGSSSGTSGTITLPDGAVVEAGSTSGTSSSSSSSGPPVCNHQHVFDDFRDIGDAPWTPMTSSWTQSAAPPSRTGNDPPILAFAGSKSADQYLEHALDPLCTSLDVTLDFQYDQSDVTIVRVFGESPTNEAIEMSIRFDLGKFEAALVVNGKPQPPARSIADVMPANTFHMMKVRFSSSGEIRLAFDSDDPKQGSPLLIPEAGALGMKATRVQLGALLAGGPTMVKLRSIDLKSQ